MRSPSCSPSATGCSFTVAGFKLASGNTQDVYIASTCSVTLNNNEYGGTTNYRVRAGNQATLAFSGTNNRISGGGIGFCLLERGAIATMFTCTFTVTASITYSTAFMTVRTLAYLEVSGNTFTLGGFAVTCSSYSVLLNGVLNGIGGNTSYFPSTSAGTTATGGQV